MKRKYYLRGLGFGILITTLVFILVGNDKMTDEEVIRRVEQLGYTVVEATTTPGIDLDALRGTSTPKVTLTPTATVAPTETTTPEEPTVTPTLDPTTTTKPAEPTETPTVAPTATTAPAELTATPTAKPTATTAPVEPTATSTVAPTATTAPTEPTVTPVESDKVTATIQVKAGMTSMQICRLIEDAGIIKDWKELNQYMINNNLADYINIGAFHLESTMSFQEIGHTLTGR